MFVELQNSKDDFNHFLKSYFFKRDFAKRLLLVIIVAFIFGGGRETGQPFILLDFIIRTVIAAVVLAIIFFAVPYVITLFKFKNSLKTKLLTQPQKITLTDEGINVTTESENNFWRWETVNKADLIDDYLFFTLFTKKLYLIPVRYFSSKNEAINFLGVIKSNSQKVRDGNRFRKIRNLYYWGLVGFIPNFGVVAGIILIIKGFQYNKIALMLVGVADILFTVFFWMIVFPLFNPNGFKDVSQMQLNSLVKNVEFYKLQNGQYPDSLQQLLKDDKFAPINDAIQIDKHRQNTYYNYKRVGDKYLLFSSGQDGIPNTSDDLYPVFSSQDSSKIGLIKTK
jgi:hypothetical protein